LDTPLTARTGLAAVVGLLLFLFPLVAAGQDARVIWVREVRVYLAAPDSLSLSPGDRVSFTERGRSRVLATGEVTTRLDAVVRAVWLTSGSLARVRRLDRLRVHTERAVVFLKRMRLGLPMARPSLLFSCVRESIAVTPGGYRRIGDREYVNEELRGGVHPETLVIRFFEDAVDEEIAFERGEIDVAVFWPGELSSRLRELRWRDRTHARWPGYVVAYTDSLAPDSLLLDAVSRQLFRNDLLWATPRRVAPPGTPYVVDSSLPGKSAIERILNRGPTRGNVPPIRIGYFEGSPPQPVRTPGVTELFLVTCPILCAPGVASQVLEMGTRNLVLRFGRCMTPP
jgi:hypothetical protein